MARILVLGAGLNGLSTAMLLAGDGHEVTVLERDPAEAPADADAAWRGWERRGVNQFRLLHYLLPRWRMQMERELPEVVTELEALGGLRTNPLAERPVEQTGGWRDGDEAYETVTARRPVIEAAVATVAGRAEGLVVRRGVAVTGLTTTRRPRSAVPHVTGVLTEGGESIGADLVVDAGGRRSALPAWLEAIGAGPPLEEREPCGFVYYGRHFRAADGSRPEVLGGPLTHYDSVSVLTLPADNGTWGVGFVTSARDRELRALKDVAVWERALGRYPAVAHWGDGEPVSDGVAVMAGIEDRYRSLVVADGPVVTGVVAVGDSWACTNPSLGRGASIGLLHARRLRDVVGEVGLDDGDKLVRRFAEVTRDDVEPHYRATLAFDRHRLAEIEADIEGRPYETDDPVWPLTKAVVNGASVDHDVARGYATIGSLLATPDEVMGWPGMFERLVELSAVLPRYVDEGPDRPDLLRVIAG